VGSGVVHRLLHFDEANLGFETSAPVRQPYQPPILLSLCYTVTPMARKIISRRLHTSAQIAKAIC
jgi:hypothetical protein